MEELKMDKNSLYWSRSLTDQRGSLYVSLPKIWCIMKGLSKGDEVVLKMLTDGTLKVISERSK